MGNPLVLTLCWSSAVKDDVQTALMDLKLYSINLDRNCYRELSRQPLKEITIDLIITDQRFLDQEGMEELSRRSWGERRRLLAILEKSDFSDRVVKWSAGSSGEFDCFVHTPVSQSVLRHTISYMLRDLEWAIDKHDKGKHLIHPHLRWKQ